MRLSTWAALLSITTSAVVIIGSTIIRSTEPQPNQRTIHLSSHLRPVKAGPRSFLASESRAVIPYPEQTQDRVPSLIPPASVARSQGVRLAPESASTLLESDTRPAPGSFHPYETTAYSAGCILPKFGPEPPPQRMANGEWPRAGVHVAADRSIPFGTVLEAVYKGLPSRLIVGDRGRWIKGNRLDLFVRSCSEARAWGRRVVMARVVEGE